MAHVHVLCDATTSLGWLCKYHWRLSGMWVDKWPRTVCNDL